jgi:ribosomal protein S12 methylthiotransferase
MAEGRILPYLDVPLQHASPRILRAMHRPADHDDTLARIQDWRAICPDLTLRSTFIVGFPGETEEDFAQLLAFLEAAELDRVGCFTYSPVAGAKANALPGAVPEAIKEERRARLMELQRHISARRISRWVGREITVLVDEVLPECAVARSAADAPEIDGQVFIVPASAGQAGEFCRVRVTGAEDHDLWATPLSMASD